MVIGTVTDMKNIVVMPLAVDVFVQCEEQIVNCNIPDTEDGFGFGNQDEEAVAMIEEIPSGDGISLNQPGTSYSVPFMDCFVSV